MNEKKDWKNMGRKCLDTQDFEAVYELYRDQKVSAVQAARMARMSLATFYRRVHEKKKGE